jgi:hypothetical protein
VLGQLLLAVFGKGVLAFLFAQYFLWADVVDGGLSESSCLLLGYLSFFCLPTFLL